MRLTAPGAGKTAAAAARGAVPLKGFIPCSFLDWPGRVASVLFLPGCTFRCPWCHNARLVLEPDLLPDVPFGDVVDTLRARAGWIDGVVVTGGEPTIHQELPDILAGLRREGLPVKLDTNGSLPGVISRLLDEGLVDHVAMDVKAPLDPDRYARLAGPVADVESVRESIGLIAASGVPHTFRTTVVPGLLDGADLADLAADLPPGSPHVLQAFRPAETLEPGFHAPPLEVEDLERLVAISAASRHGRPARVTVGA